MALLIHDIPRALGGLGAAPAYEPVERHLVSYHIIKISSSSHQVDRHFKIPHGVWMKEATSVAVDSEDNLFVFNRGNLPVIVFDPEVSPALSDYNSNSIHR